MQTVAYGRGVSGTDGGNFVICARDFKGYGRKCGQRMCR